MNRVRMHAQSEWRRYPLSAIQDYYKLIYQSVWGIGHFISDERVFFEILADEWNGIEPSSSEPLIIDITLDDPIGRLNLKTAKQKGMSLTTVHSLCMHTQSAFSSKLELSFGKLVCHLLKTLDKPPFTFPDKDIKSFGEFAERNNYPLIRHSTIYRTHYDPHYRLIAKASWEDIARVKEGTHFSWDIK
ncbi:hypothetical protein JW979_12765 [bacterium]|nr:hypothetical protein [candidate division CSSED10-310 bacterium]